MRSLRTEGIVAFEPLSRTRRLARRRLALISSLAALAAAGWLFGALSASTSPPAPSTALGAFTSS